MEMEEIRQEDEAQKAAGFVSVVKLFRMRSLRWQLISVIILMGGQQLSGVNAVRGGPGGGGGGQGPSWGLADPRACGVSFQIYYYADQIYVSAGVNTHDVQYVTVGTGAVNMVVTFLAVSILGRWVPSAGEGGGRPESGGSPQARSLALR